MRSLGWLRYGPFFAHLVVIRRCNLSCGYCNEFDDSSDPVPAALLRQRIDKIAELGTLSLELTGGEPLMHPDIIDLVAYARVQGFVQRKIITNAYLLSADKVEQLSKAGLTHMQISLDGAVPNDVTVKVLRPLKPKLRHVLEHATFKVTLSAVVGAAPASEVREVVEFAEHNGLRPRVLLVHDGDGQFALSDANRALFEEVAHKLGRHWRQAGNYRTKLMKSGRAPFKCRAGSRYLYVDEFGQVRWCSQTRADWGRDLMDYGPRDLEEQFHTQKPCHSQCTLGCVRNSSKIDQWRAQHLPPPRLPDRLPVVR